MKILSSTRFFLSIIIFSITLKLTLSQITEVKYLESAGATCQQGDNFFYMDLQPLREMEKKKNKLFFDFYFREGFYVKKDSLNFYYCYSNSNDPGSCEFQKQKRYYAKTKDEEDHYYYKVSSKAEDYKYIILDFEFLNNYPDVINLESTPKENKFYIRKIVIWSVVAVILLILIIVIIIICCNDKIRSCCFSCCENSGTFHDDKYDSVPKEIIYGNDKPVPQAQASEPKSPVNQQPNAEEESNLVDSSNNNYGTVDKKNNIDDAFN